MEMKYGETPMNKRFQLTVNEMCFMKKYFHSSILPFFHTCVCIFFIHVEESDLNEKMSSAHLHICTSANCILTVPNHSVPDT